MCITSSTEMRLNKVCCHLTCVDGKSRRGRRGCPRGASQAPPVFDQQAFAEAVGVAAAVIA